MPAALLSANLTDQELLRGPVLLIPQGPRTCVFAGYGEDGKPDEEDQPVRKYGHHRSTDGGCGAELATST
jgi:hypothetical protein